jgi:hypothetical protein
MPQMIIYAAPDKKWYDDSSNDMVYSVFFFFWFLVLAFGDLKINLSY